MVEIFRMALSLLDGKGRGVLRGLALVVLLAGLIALVPAGWKVDAASRTQQATTSSYVPPPRPGEKLLDLPEPLSAKDVQLYRRIFDYQERGHWRSADRLIRQLSDRLLMGHVLAQRYLHPTAYRSRFSELKRWLAKYHDHADAARIYSLAMKRKPRRAARPHRPSGRFLVGSGGDVAFRDKPYRSSVRYSRSARRDARRYRVGIRRRLRNGWPTGAMQLLKQRRAYQVFDRVERDELWTDIAAGYYFAGLDAKAYRHASGAGRRSGTHVPQAHWYAGLAAWRMGDIKKAGKQFEAVTRASAAGDWSVSAGAYWASRAALRQGKPREMSRWLKMAAVNPRTFYGQLAVRSLGLTPPLNWTAPRVTQADLRALSYDAAGRRGLALLQIGENHRAEGELRATYSRADHDLREAILAVASLNNMPSLSMYLGWLAAKRDQGIMDLALYPLPSWTPQTGFTIDRAVVFALMRQESAFMPRATSHMGARGLMQLMPQTARFVARTKNLPLATRSALFQPAYNMALGQGYVEHLLENRFIDDNLFHVIASYNAGPGNVMKWDKSTRHGGDPLLFIESIPSGENRDFIERVFTNLWIYRQRLGQPTPSLDAVAQNDWPRYHSLDRKTGAIAVNVPRP